MVSFVDSTRLEQANIADSLSANSPYNRCFGVTYCGIPLKYVFMASLAGDLHLVMGVDSEQRMGGQAAALILQGSIRRCLSRMEKKFLFTDIIQQHVSTGYNPRIRMDRYNCYTVKQMEGLCENFVGENQVGLYYLSPLGQRLILNDSVPQFQWIVSGLLRFRDIYSSQLCPVLIDAEMVCMKIEAICLSPNLFRIQDHAEELGIVATFIRHQAAIFESALHFIDGGLFWMWASSLVEPYTSEPAPPHMDFRIPVWRLRTELIPRARDLIQCLMDSLEQ